MKSLTIWIVERFVDHVGVFPVAYLSTKKLAEDYLASMPGHIREESYIREQELDRELIFNAKIFKL